MTRPFSLLCLCLLVSRTAAADAIVTWHAEGEIGSSTYFGLPTPLLPPAGTPYQLSLTFNQSLVTPTGLSPAGSNCFTVPVSGSLTVGGFAHALGGLGFTHATLPGSNCTPGSQETQFILGIAEPSVPSPWILADGFMELWYRDLLIRDAFPDSPTSEYGGFQIRDQFFEMLVNADLNLEGADVQQPAPVPEPGTLMLFGLGLAAIARKVRKRPVAFD
jgi:hypothetical protein